MAQTRSHESGEVLPWLPASLMEHVLSFLPVPALCRCRTVCKGWKELLATPSFQQLWRAHGVSHRKPHLFVTQTSNEGKRRPATSGTTCFLDLDERRWYSVKTEYDNHGNHEVDAGVMAIHDGLVCELCPWRNFDPNFRGAMVLFDPIVGNRREISPLPMGNWHSPQVAISVNDVTRSFKVFIFEQEPIWDGKWQNLFVYESSKKKWRVTENPTNDANFPVPHALCSTFFRGRLYVVSMGAINTYDGFGWHLLSFDFDEFGDTWELITDDLMFEVIPRLVVSGDRLFLMRWVFGSLWMHEIIDGSLCQDGQKIITDELVDDVFHEWWRHMIPALPILGSDGSCSSVVFVSKESGKVYTYDLASKVIDIFPESPASMEAGHLSEYYRKHMYYWGQPMYLNIRNSLSDFA